MPAEKDPKDHKLRQNFTFDPETIAALRKRSEESDVPQARIVERAVRIYLGLEPKVAKPEDK